MPRLHIGKEHKQPPMKPLDDTLDSADEGYIMRECVRLLNTARQLYRRQPTPRLKMIGVGLKEIVNQFENSPEIPPKKG